MAAQYIFSMQGLSKTYPGGKKVFENIWLSFYPDAKIGVVGVNGSGKSTLLKIMAGLDKEFTGEARAADGTKMGYLHQEPQLDTSLDVYGNVISECEEKKIFDRYNAIALEMAENYTDELMEEMNALQEKIDAGDLWDLVNGQDWAVCESVQRGMSSRAYEQGWFAPMEDASADIRRWLLPRLDA